MFRKAIHTVPAILILVCTTGFTLNLHYCHGRLYDLAVNAPAHSCCDPGSRKPCHDDKNMDMASHCQEESIQVKTTDEFVGSSFHLLPTDDHSIDLFYFTICPTELQYGEDDVQHEPPWYRKPPPFTDVDLSRIQTFLI